MTIHKCDRCGAEIIFYSPYIVTYPEIISGGKKKDMELCGECYDSLMEWFGHKAEEPHEIKAYKLNEPNPVFNENHRQEVTDKTEQNGGGQSW